MCYVKWPLDPFSLANTLTLFHIQINQNSSQLLSFFFHFSLTCPLHVSIVLKVLFVELQHHFLDSAHWPVWYANFKRIRPELEVGWWGRGWSWDGRPFMPIFQESCTVKEAKLSYSLLFSKNWLPWTEDSCFRIRPECWRVRVNWFSLLYLC